MGKTVTFYSYKGGVGRSMALANVAVQLSQWQYKTLMVDWDFEAPGLEFFFANYLNVTSAQARPGMVDLLRDFIANPDSNERKPLWSELTTPIRISDSHEEIHLLTSGQRDEAYFSKVRSLDIGEFYKQQGGHFIEQLRNQWHGSYDFVLIDSRTGVTDIGGVCTVQLPDILVLLFTTNDQSLDGIVQIAEKARRVRKTLPFDRFSLKCLPVASRVDAKEEFKEYQQWLEATVPKLKPLMSNWLPDASSWKFVESSKLPYIPFFSFGEKLAIIEQGTSDTGGLGYAYESVAGLVANDLAYAARFVEDRDSYIHAAFKRQSFDDEVEKEQRRKDGTPSKDISVTPRNDFFISYAHADRSWAEWVAWELEEAGYTTVLQAWDFKPGSNFALEMQQAALDAHSTIALFSPDYLLARFTQPEWQAAFAQDPTGEKGLLIPVRVRESEIEILPTQIVYIDLVGLDAAAARIALLNGIRHGRAKPVSAPHFPGMRSQISPTPPRFPGGLSSVLSSVWTVPYVRNPRFIGRDYLIGALHSALTETNTMIPLQVLQGLGGAGKTQIAIEYAYRYGAEYQLVCWMRAESHATLASDYASLATILELPEKNASDQAAAIYATRLWLEQNTGWLLIFDHVTVPADLRAYLPRSPSGHVIITSRYVGWGGMARLLTVSVLSREESVRFLLDRTVQADTEAATALAEAFGDLPLALAQAAAYIDATGLSLSAYLQRLKTHFNVLLSRGDVGPDYPQTVATTWELAFQALQETQPATIDLLRLCAFLAPDAIPNALLRGNPLTLPEALGTVVADDLQWDEALVALRRYALIEVGEETLFIHRLVQAVTRDRLSADERTRWAVVAAKLVMEAFPEDDSPLDPRTWPTYARLLPHALAVVSHNEGENAAPEATARLLNHIGLYLEARAQYAEAGPLYQRALALRERVLGPEHPDVAASLNNLAVLYHAQGRYAEAEPLYQRALVISEAMLGPEHPDTAWSLNNLAELYRAQGRYSDAEPLCQRALALRERVLGPEHPDTARSLNNLAVLYHAQGRYAEAELLYQRALVISEAMLGPEHPDTAWSLNNLAELYRAQGRYSDAEPLYQRALVLRERVLGPEPEQSGRTLPGAGALQ
jgi:tetratricopeptide (TPR) repeat protein/cellulose biosynthesis protein BcsQ